ncbi:MAG: replicative DNA helicase, partial [bacterium]
VTKSDLPRVPPHHLEAERSALGCCLLNHGALLTVVNMLRGEDFFHPPHRYIFEAIISLFHSNIDPDYVSLTNILMTSGTLEKAGSADYISGLTNVVPSVQNAEHYATIVKEKSTLREVQRLGNEMSAFAGEGARPPKEILDWSSRRLLDLLRSRESQSYATISDASSDFLAEYNKNYANKEPPGISTGFSDLDAKLLGFQPGNLIILAARPSQGKTALALDIARNVAETGKSVAFVSLEMSKEELVIRLLCSTAMLDGYRLRLKRLSDKADVDGKTDWDRLNEAMRRLGSFKLFIDDSSSLTISELRAKIKTIALEHELDMVIVDYLQLIDGELGAGDMRVQEVTKISRNLKGLARELHVPVLTLSQLSRHIERREGFKKIPQLSDLRESGAIEQDADVVLFIHREITEEDEREGRQYDPDDVQDTQLIVAKNRNGAIGKVYLEFFRRFATFKQSTQPPVTYTNI